MYIFCHPMGFFDTAAINKSPYMQETEMYQPHRAKEAILSVVLVKNWRKHGISVTTLIENTGAIISDVTGQMPVNS
jgi:hypothetical protein